MPIAATRALLTAALDGSLARVRVPHATRSSASRCPIDVPGVDAALLDPRAHLGRPRRLRRPGREARRDVRGELRPVRGPRLRRRAGRRDQRRLTRPAGASVARSRPLPRRDDPVPPLRLRAVERGVRPRQRLRQRQRRRPPAPAPSSPPLTVTASACPPSIATGARATASRSRSAITAASVGRHVGEDREELLAADPPEQVAAAAARRHPPGHLLQHPVADGVAVARR